jgi:hypothetical protein
LQLRFRYVLRENRRVEETATEIVRRWPLVVLAMAVGLISLFVLWANLYDDYNRFWASHIYPPLRFVVNDAVTILCGSIGLIVSFLLHRCILTSRHVSKSITIALGLFFILFVALLFGSLYLSDL